ncbi:MAG: D-alanine--D-alanine ligase [Gammaproteobacteria bacterium]|nr:D-alanine--D-alanine ligase [Gammaproteobacteria bacterium]MDH5651516.1 D-alanine--D-alanine ligase [Gammaproteobacteria bacterium]
MSSKLIDPQTFGKVAVLLGGWSAEREVSLKSGAAVLAALQSRGVNAHGVDVQRETIMQDLQQGGFDRVFNILHGPGGEDGVIQGMLEVMGLPYTGSGVLASALAMDKLRSKQILDAIGLPTPNYMVLDSDTDVEYVAATLGLPLMVKPAQQGSSIGMTRVEEVSQLHNAWLLAAEYEGAVLAEQWIVGQEFTVAILGDEALPAIRLETPHGFYDYEAKYQSNDTRYIIPCGLDKHAEAQLQRLARATFNAMGASGWGRVDIFVDQQGEPWILELNTLPGMTDHSLVPMAAKAAGIEFDELVIRILQQSMA